MAFPKVAENIPVGPISVRNAHFQRLCVCCDRASVLVNRIMSEPSAGSVQPSESPEARSDLLKVMLDHGNGTHPAAGLFPPYCTFPGVLSLSPDTLQV